MKVVSRGALSEAGSSWTTLRDGSRAQGLSTHQLTDETEMSADEEIGRQTKREWKSSRKETQLRVLLPSSSCTLERLCRVRVFRTDADGEESVSNAAGVDAIAFSSAIWCL